MNDSNSDVNFDKVESVESNASYSSRQTHSHSTYDDFGEPVYNLGNMSREDVSQKKLIAALLAIFLGSLGIHKFYLEAKEAGVIMLALTLGSAILGSLLLVVFIGLLILPIAGLVSLVGLAEGIYYITKSDEQFYKENIIEKRPWF